mgnify:CR=1 FL=1
MVVLRTTYLYYLYLNITKSLKLANTVTLFLKYNTSEQRWIIMYSWIFHTIPFCSFIKILGCKFVITVMADGRIFESHSERSTICTERMRIYVLVTVLHNMIFLNITNLQSVFEADFNNQFLSGITLCRVIK